MLPQPGAPRRPFTHPIWVLAALIIGLGSGLLLHASGSTTGLNIAAALEPIGLLWCAAMRLLAYPLVICLVITTLAGPGPAPGRTTLLALVTFIAMLLAGAALALALTPPALSLMGVNAGVLAGAAPIPAPLQVQPTPQGSNWLSTILGAPLDRALLSSNLFILIVLSALVGLALRRINAASRATLVNLFQAALDLLLHLLSWLLAVAPLAVLSLALPMGARAGLGGAGALASYVGITIVLLLIFTALLYPIASLLGHIPVSRFAIAAAPVQAVAMGSRSSIASLPALLDAGRRLDLPAEVNGLVNPLAVAIFKANRTISGTIKYLFLARAFGIETDLPTTLAYVGATLLVSFSTPGIPSAGPVVSTPALLAAGIPMEGIALTYAVDSIPDIFKTLANVTADLAAACIVAARTPRRPTSIPTPT